MTCMYMYTFGDEELYGLQVSSSSGLHQWSATSLRLMLLYIRTEIHKCTHTCTM